MADGYGQRPKYSRRKIYFSFTPWEVLLGEAGLAAFRWGLACGYCRSASIPEENRFHVFSAEYLQGSLLTFPIPRVSVACVFL